MQKPFCAGNAVTPSVLGSFPTLLGRCPPLTRENQHTSLWAARAPRSRRPQLSRQTGSDRFIRNGRPKHRRELRNAPRNPCALGLSHSSRWWMRPGGGPVEGGHAMGDRPGFAALPRGYSGVQPRGGDGSWAATLLVTALKQGAGAGGGLLLLGLPWKDGLGGCRRRGPRRAEHVLRVPVISSRRP